jgi:ubiquinone/menaquinone biosynthesis C-methylase UbiE
MSAHRSAARHANFDAIARPYRWMEYLTFGRKLERCRTHFLEQLADRRSAMILGDGDGRFTARLLAACPNLSADAVDTSAAMLRLLTRRALATTPTAATRLRTRQGSALDFFPTNSYDLIVTHFFLDCLAQNEVNALAQRLAACVTPNALWLVSDFRIPSGRLHWPARGLIRLLYLGFRILTGLRITRLPDHAAALTAAGFSLVSQHHSLAGLLTSELWEYTPAMQLPPQRPKHLDPPDPLPDPDVFRHEPARPPEQPSSSRD